MGIGALNRCVETHKRHQALRILDQALHVARCVESRDERAWLYVQIGYTLLKAGDRQRARELVEQCLRMTLGSNLPSRDAILRWAAGVLAELGEIERAWGLLRLIREAQQRDLGLDSFVKHLARTGQWGRALQVVHTIADEEERHFAMYRIVQQMSGAGETRLAVDTAHKIGDVPLRASAFQAIAEEQWRRGHSASARALLWNATRLARQEQVLWWGTCEIAMLWAKMGATHLARSLFQEVRWRARLSQDDEYSADDWLRDVVEAQVKAGYIRDALDTAFSISDEFCRAETLNEIALQLARLGKCWDARRLWEQALQTARSYAGAFNRCGMLRTIAEAHAKTGYTRQARGLFDESIAAALATDRQMHEPELLLSGIAAGQAGSGMLSDALRTARRLASKPYDYADTLNGIAEALLWSEADEEE